MLGPVESLSEITFTDVQFSHNRGFYLAVYNWALWNMPFIAPIAAGFVTDRYGWQWIQYIVTIVCAAICIFLFLFLEETMYYREQIPEELLDDQSDKTVPSNGSTRGEVTIVEPTQKDSKTVSDVVTSDIADGSTNYVPRTFFQKIKLWGHRDPRQPNTLVEDFYLPFILVRFPATVFGGLLVGGSLSWLNVVNGTIALVLGSAPYHFSTNMIGVACLSCVIGVSAGCLLGGWVSDKFAEGMARRNKGVREPEHRLVGLPKHLSKAMTSNHNLGNSGWLFYPLSYILLDASSMVLVHSMRFTGLVFYSALARSLSAYLWEQILHSITFLTFTRRLEDRQWLPAFCFATPWVSSSPCIIQKHNNTNSRAGFGFAFAVVPMIDSLGLQYTFITLGFLGFAFWFMCVFMIFFGKALRAKTAPEYWKLVERRGAVAH